VLVEDVGLEFQGAVVLPFENMGRETCLYRKPRAVEEASESRKLIE